MSGQTRGRTVTPSSPAGREREKEGGGGEDGNEDDLELLGRDWKPK